MAQCWYDIAVDHGPHGNANVIYLGGAANGNNAA